MSPAVEAALKTTALVVGVIAFFVAAALYPAVVLGAVFVVALLLGIYLLFTGFYEDAKRRAAIKALHAEQEAKIKARDERLRQAIEATEHKLTELEERFGNGKTDGTK